MRKNNLHHVHGKHLILIYKKSAALMGDAFEQMKMKSLALKRMVAARHHLLFTLDKTFSDLVSGIQFNGRGEFRETLSCSSRAHGAYQRNA